MHIFNLCGTSDDWFSYEMALGWMPVDANALKSSLAQVMASFQDITQGSTLRHARAPRPVDLVSGHIHFCGYVPDRANDFSVRACSYFPSSVHKLYRACTNIGWAYENFCRAHNFLEPGHVNQMLNVKPCSTWTIVDQGPISLTFIPPQFKFDGNFVSLSYLF